MLPRRTGERPFRIDPPTPGYQKFTGRGNHSGQLVRTITGHFYSNISST
ncbi:hypothetical protein STTU_4877 [Streptomyces sp. Tu6071]|nr:hypothetical protein STTU_4877 [Streptomyces sp. Tu6071]